MGILFNNVIHFLRRKPRSKDKDAGHHDSHRSGSRRRETEEEKRARKERERRAKKAQEEALIKQEDEAEVKQEPYDANEQGYGGDMEVDVKEEPEDSEEEALKVCVITNLSGRLLYHDVNI